MNTRLTDDHGSHDQFRQVLVTLPSVVALVITIDQ